MTFLNSAFALGNIVFEHSGTNRVINETWFTHVGVDELDPDKTFESEMKAALGTEDSPGVLDVYSSGLGWSTTSASPNSKVGYITLFPFQFALGGLELEKLRVQGDGVTMTWVSFPDGLFEKAFLGSNLVHEIGHWAGLFHTFTTQQEPGSCEGPGDYVRDTPVQAYAAHLKLSAFDTTCVAQDTCPNNPGSDAINNYMDYAPEACRTEFTPGQFKRMRDILSLYRDIET
ncbi:hypothetical protein FA15DRAFT_703087 [Coprinopsis marcescibilis]|uniref:Peptidase M43 pregnancy-associated plasma-A domain-containing protein n=1 Tax=Coprinopsis marcescibilis TaxID=230819 RepID=A0A5C3L0Q2_COPMA|nr:hypothetical protein FA15DRAFT_703087 [Coprinopsis marcescibilis]